jgi:hypothetical protein
MMFMLAFVLSDPRFTLTNQYQQTPPQQTHVLNNAYPRSIFQTYVVIFSF